MIYGHEYNYVVEHGINMGSVNQETGVSVAGDTSASPYRDASKMSKLPSSTNFKTDTEISGSKGGRQNDKLTEWKADERTCVFYDRIIMQLLMKVLYTNLSLRRKPSGTNLSMFPSSHNFHIVPDQTGRPSVLKARMTRISTLLN